MAALSLSRAVQNLQLAIDGRHGALAVRAGMSGHTAASGSRSLIGVQTGHALVVAAEVEPDAVEQANANGREKEQQRKERYRNLLRMLMESTRNQAGSTLRKRAGVIIVRARDGRLPPSPSSRESLLA